MLRGKVKQFGLAAGQLPWRRWLCGRGAIIAAGALLLYALAGFFLAPWLVSRYLPRYVAEQLHHQVRFDRLRINPLLFTVEATNFRLADAEGRPLLTFARLSVDFELESLFRRAWTFADIRLETPTLSLLIGADGRLNLAKFLAMLPQEEPPAERPSRLLVKQALLAVGAVYFADDSGPAPVRATLASVAMELREISTLPEQCGSYAVTAVLPEGGRLGWQGKTSLVPLAASGTLVIDDLKTAAVWEFLREHLNLNLAEPAGMARLRLDYRFAHQPGETSLVVQPLDIALRNLVLTEKGRQPPLLQVEQVTAANGRFDLTARQLRFPMVSLRGGALAASRDPAGRFNWQRLLAPAGTGPHKDREEPAAAAGKEPVRAGAGSDAPPPPWRVAADRLELSGFAVDFVDHGFRPAVAYGLRDLGLTVEGFDTAGKKPLRLAARAKVAQGGSVAVAGSVSQDGKEAAGQVRLDQLDLRPLAPLLRARTWLRLARGALSLDSRVAYRAGEPGPTLTATGNAGISRLLLIESDTGDRFLAWQELSAAGIDLSLAPDRLAIGEMRLVAPGAKIVVFKDRSANLARIFKEDKGGPPQPPPGRSNAEQPAERRFPFLIGRVRLENGVVDFADQSLVLPFAARIERFRGTALNLADDPAGRTTLRFDGQVGKFGEAKVAGSLALMAPKRFTDLKVTFRNVDLPPLSPYTATFAGRRIASGRLDLDLGYRIEKSQLLGDNKVLLRDFTLGERVESPSALDLPLDLAIALLTDAEGRIDVAVPVEGNVDQPEFSYGHLIWQAVRTLLDRIVTAPFRALGTLFGFGTAEADTVVFAPGQSEMAPPEREKLYKVAAVLDQRDKLVLTVHGTLSRELDGAVAVRRAVAKRLGIPLEPEDDPPVAFAQAKTQRALETMAGADISAFQAEYEKGAGRKVRRVNPVLALVGRGSSDDLDFYQALFAHLVKTAPFVEKELQELAVKRRIAMIQELVVAIGLAPGRVVAGDTEEAEGKDGAVPMHLEVGVR